MAALASWVAAVGAAAAAPWAVHDVLFPDTGTATAVSVWQNPGQVPAAATSTATSTTPESTTTSSTTATEAAATTSTAPGASGSAAPAPAGNEPGPALLPSAGEIRGAVGSGPGPAGGADLSGTATTTIDNSGPGPGGPVAVPSLVTTSTTVDDRRRDEAATTTTIDDRGHGDDATSTTIDDHGGGSNSGPGSGSNGSVPDSSGHG